MSHSCIDYDVVRWLITYVKINKRASLYIAGFLADKSLLRPIRILAKDSSEKEVYELLSASVLLFVSRID